MDDRSSLRLESQSMPVGRAGSAHAPVGARSYALLPLVLGIIWLSGCVERRMTIRTNVDNQGGALVYIDNQEVGYSPISTAFTYYADREIKLVKDGFESVTLVQPIEAPWWDSLFLEFFTENLWPFTLRDERQFFYELPPSVAVSTNELIDRGQQLRTEAELGAEIVPGVRPAGGSSPVNF